MRATLRSFHLAAAVVFVSAAAAGPAAAAEKSATVYRYAGEPIRLQAQCAEEDFQGPAATCTRANPCPIYLELTDVKTNGTRIFASGNLHTDSDTLFSVLLVSLDGGRSWKEAADRVSGGALERIQFWDQKTGWVGGQILSPSTRDAFFLLTTDSGESWRKRPVTADQRSGFIEAYQFESGDIGYVWIDRMRGADNGMRYEMYETMTGGETWMLREVSDREIARRRSMRVLPEADWRARVTEDGYTIENRTLGGWQKVAVFAVEAGTCAPVEEQERELPPRPPSEAVEEQPSDVFRIPTNIPSRRPTTAPRKPPTLKK